MAPCVRIGVVSACCAVCNRTLFSHALTNLSHASHTLASSTYSLLACIPRYCTAYKKACKSTAVRKYFEHAGALMTADGTGDDLIQLEGVPLGQVFSF